MVEERAPTSVSTPPVYAAVLWDMDGTLVDTEPYWIETEYAIAERHGGTWSEEHALNLVGNDLLESGRYIREHMGIDVEPSQIQIGVDGTVSGMLPGQTTAQTFGTIGVVRFINPAGLSSSGGNLYQATAASGNEIQGIAGQNGFGQIRQGFVERSNVEVVTELISLISAQRAYEINSRAVRAADEMLSVTSDIVR